MGWAEDVINYHKDPKQFDKWCGYCGCEGGCNLCDKKSLEIATKLIEENGQRNETTDRILP